MQINRLNQVFSFSLAALVVDADRKVTRLAL